MEHELQPGEVCLYAEIVATPKYMLDAISEWELSDYQNTNLIDAYEDSNGEVRYLTIDVSAVSGMVIVTIYQIELNEPGATYSELAKIQFPYNGSGYEMDAIEYYLKGEALEPGATIDDELSEYMMGYDRIEIPYDTSSVVFPRNIEEYSEEERMEILEELYADF